MGTALFLLGAVVAIGAGAAQAQQAEVVRSVWRTVCSTEADGKWRCQMVRTVPGPNHKGVLMQMVITRSASEKGTQAQFLVPLGVHLPAGVEFTPEKSKPLKVAYTSCSAAGCIAPFTMDDALVGQLKAGGKLDVRFLMRDQKPVSVAIDLKGFAEAFDKLTQK
jgi:invasion protein IalB